MLQTGDIVKWKFPDCDDVVSYGMITERSTGFCSVFWFDDNNTCEHEYFQLVKVS
jgi:hypothetical protein